MAPTAAEIAAGLRRTRADWLPRIFPAGKLVNGTFYIGSAEGDAGRSLPVPLTSDKAEDLVDFGGSFRGDDLDLYARGRRLELPEAMAEAARFLGLDDLALHRVNGTKPTKRKPPTDAEKAEMSGQLWRRALKDHAALDRYLSDERGIPKPAEGWPKTVRFHPGMPEGFSVGRHRPALLMPKTDPAGNLCGLHAVFLKPDGSGKADLAKPKKSFGAGGVVVIRGEGKVVLACEGPEDALSLAAAMPEAAVICTAGAGTLHRVAQHLPAGACRVVLVADRDEAGRIGAEKAARAVAETGVPVAIAQPPASMKDANDVLHHGGTEAIKIMVEAAAPFDPGAAGSDALAEFTDPTTLQGVEPPQREMIVPGWLPTGTVASLYGAPGVGKTLLAQVLGSAVAAGRPFLGLKTVQCNVLAVFCEDDGQELHRRQVAINAGLDIGMQDLGALRYQGRYGRLNVMAASRNGVVEMTPFYSAIRAAALQFGARLVILDNIAQLFAGDENNRSEVTQFVNALGALAQEIHGAVLLLGHPGKGTGSEYSGSTAWDAAVRTRWILERPKSADGQEAAETADLRVLRKPKANYGSTGDEITLRWDLGTFRPEGPAIYKDTVDRIEEQARERRDENAFLACLDALNQQGRAVSHAVQARSYAPRAMSRLPQAQGVGLRRLERAMERLFTAGAIRAGMRIGQRSNRHPLFGIGRVEDEPEPADAPCATARHSPAQPVDIVALCGCAAAAPERAEVLSKPLKSLRQGACARDPIDTTYLSVPLAGGGGTDPCTAEPEPDEDTEVFE